MEKTQSEDAISTVLHRFAAQPLMATVRNKAGYIEIMNVYQGRAKDIDHNITGEIHPLAIREKTLLEIIRMDLQLQFFWSFALTLLSVFWKPFIIAGLLVTMTKEFVNVAVKRGWRWGDFIWGMAGFVTAILFIYKTGLGG